ncbi:hypothetical protein [Streptomyces sp. SID8352]|uniref:hypothetical protein n=1 Tax=Streptomyces sp. SID8352 TaxID=2690338 RepID=UPI001369B3DD|nr:hypothetical protein [Streptomyces sp. SID8352]MYU26220.1 hypothetical protein [Streptomyces sp. SID8352]
MAFGLMTLSFGALWAVDYRGMVTRLYPRQFLEREQLPQRLRRMTPPPAQPADQRASGVLLAFVGLVFAVAGVRALMP